MNGHNKNVVFKNIKWWDYINTINIFFLEKALKLVFREGALVQSGGRASAVWESRHPCDWADLSHQRSRQWSVVGGWSVSGNALEDLPSGMLYWDSLSSIELTIKINHHNTQPGSHRLLQKPDRLSALASHLFTSLQCCKNSLKSAVNEPVLRVPVNLDS